LRRRVVFFGTAEVGNHATGEIKLSDDDLAEIQRCAFDYKQGGFEDRLVFIFGRVLGPKFGREE
jgi:hypothetical protein